jgi:hypothetical protein
MANRYIVFSPNNRLKDQDLEEDPGIKVVLSNVECNSYEAAYQVAAYLDRMGFRSFIVDRETKETREFRVIKNDKLAPVINIKDYIKGKK